MSTDDVLQLEQPLKDGGIRSVNFFNGRLLTSRDFSREQAARREADWRVGLALGDGVAFGLEVAADENLDQPHAPVLRVKAGLAVNRKGQALRLLADTSLALSRRYDTRLGRDGFCDCSPLRGGAYIAGAGIYVLTVAPAGLKQGSAPTNGLDPANVRCAVDANMETLQFRLLQVPGARYLDLDLSSSQFRNLIAYRCFGIEQRQRAATDPWRQTPARYGLIDDLRGAGLSDEDVPLALVYWTAAGLQFVDTWAVRRQLLSPDALSSFTAGSDPLVRQDLASTPTFGRLRIRMEAHAMCAQFQHHLADVLDAAADPASVVATTYFRYLPPFGFIPLAASPLRGFADPGFFSGIVRCPLPGWGQKTQFIDARQLGALRQAAQDCAPTNVTLKEFIWVYRPWQNAKALDDGQMVQPVVVFASGLTPDLALPRADMARANYSNYASCCQGS